MAQLRPYQENALQKIKLNLDRNITRQLIRHPTGAGKTRTFSSIPDYLSIKGRMLVIIHREELARQSVKALQFCNPTRTVGLEMADSYSSSLDQIVVASIQTIGRSGSSRLTKFNPESFDVIVCDEAHRSIADSYMTVFNHFKVFEPDCKILLLGVTATVSRGDRQGLNKVYQAITDDLSILWGIKNGWLVDLRGVRVRSDVVLDNVHTRAGDLAKDELGEAVNVSPRNEMIAKAWLAKGEDRRSLVYGVNVEHTKAIAAAFRKNGVPAEAIWGSDPDRADKLKAHRANEFKVLANCEILTEGYDDPGIGCIVMARPTKSEGLYTQIVGRGTRLPEGVDNLIEAKRRGQQIEKTDCIILDVCDVTRNHSLVSLPSLFGLPANLDLAGRSVTRASEQLSEATKRVPGADFDRLKSIDDLDKFVEEVDLFKVTYPPEIIQISDYQWHRTFDGSYVLLLLQGESVCVFKDLLDRWIVKGTVNGAEFDQAHAGFEPAIKEADSMVRILGGRSTTSCIRRVATWHSQPPTQVQLNLARRLGIAVPAGSTKGEIHARINAELAKRKKKVA